MFIITEEGNAVNLNHVALIKAMPDGRVIATGPALAEVIAEFEDDEECARVFVSVLLESGENIGLEEDGKPRTALCASSVRQFVLELMQPYEEDGEEANSDDSDMSIDDCLMLSLFAEDEEEDTPAEFLKRLLGLEWNSQN